MPAKLVLEAPAKINLYLEVGPLRADGYHSVRTVMQAIELCDMVEIALGPGGGRIELQVEGDAPAGDENLCVQAAESFSAWLKKPMAARIKLRKRIPKGAGLGGGSSDAAAVLRGLLLLSEADMSRDELFRLAASLGSDVPFFLIGGTALGMGRGEEIFPLVQAPPLLVVLANPGNELSTRLVYERFDLVGGGEPHDDGPGPLIESLAAGAANRIPALLFNSLQQASTEIVPDTLELMERAREAGAEGCLVSGSGPTIFALANNEEQAVMLENEMKQVAPWVLRTSFRSCGVSLLSPSL